MLLQGKVDDCEGYFGKLGVGVGGGMHLSFVVSFQIYVPDLLHKLRVITNIYSGYNFIIHYHTF